MKTYKKIPKVFHKFSAHFETDVTRHLLSNRKYGISMTPGWYVMTIASSTSPGADFYVQST
jgi:hypothetical protein